MMLACLDHVVGWHSLSGSLSFYTEYSHLHKAEYLTGRCLGFINRKKNNGCPKTVPCGTPLMTGKLSEVAPLTSTGR